MAQLLLLLLWVVVGSSAALPETPVGHSEGFDLTANVIFNQIALQEEHKGLDDGIKTVLRTMLNLTEVVCTKLALQNRCTQDIEEKNNITRHLLDKLERVDSVNHALEAENRQLKADNAELREENSLVKRNNTFLREENTLVMKASTQEKEDNSLLREENTQLWEKNLRLMKENNRLMDEISLLREDNTQVREESTQVIKNNTLLMGENSLVRENNTRLEEENTQVIETNTRLTEENSQLKQDNTLLTEENTRILEENINLKAAIELLEEVNIKMNNSLRITEEDNRRLSAATLEAQEELRLTKERNQDLELAVTEAGEERKITASRTAELERENLLCKQEKSKTQESNMLVEEQLSRTEGEISSLRETNEDLQEEKERNEQLIRSIEKEKQQIFTLISLMEEENQELKRNITNLSTRVVTARDCAELYCRGARMDGVYQIKPARNGGQVSVWCDMTGDGGGWTVFIKRDKAAVPWEDFAKDWSDYKAGFGNVSSEYWLGLETLHQLTQNSPQALRFTATDDQQNEHRWAHYSTFSVASESTQYQLLVDGYQDASTIGDNMVRPHSLSGSKFSTRDKDNDNKDTSCTETHSNGGGWWYNNCGRITPTTSHEGLLRQMIHTWTPNVEKWVAVKLLEMMIRPQNFTSCHD